MDETVECVRPGQLFQKFNSEPYKYTLLRFYGVSKLTLSHIDYLYPAGTSVEFQWSGSSHNVNEVGSAEEFDNCNGITDTAGMDGASHSLYPVPIISSLFLMSFYPFNDDILAQQVHLVPTPGLPLPMRESTTLSVESPSTVLWATSRPLLRSPTTVENFDRRICNRQIKHHSIFNWHILDEQ